MISQTPTLNEQNAISVYPRSCIYFKYLFFGLLLFAPGAALIVLMIARWHEFFSAQNLHAILTSDVKIFSAFLAGIWLLYSHFPGANQIRVDETGFTYKRHWKSKRVEFSDISHMFAVSGRRSGIKVIFRDDPKRKPFLIADEFKIDLQNLLTFMSQHAGPSVATTAPILTTNDLASRRKIANRMIWVSSALIFGGALLDYLFVFKLGHQLPKEVVMAIPMISIVAAILYMFYSMNRLSKMPSTSNLR
jgi:hypothetical protein